MPLKNTVVSAVVISRNLPTTRRFSSKHLRSEKGTGAEMRRAIIYGMVTGDAPVNHWPTFLTVPSDSLRSTRPSFLAPKVANKLYTLNF